MAEEDDATLATSHSSTTKSKKRKKRLSKAVKEFLVNVSEAVDSDPSSSEEGDAKVKKIAKVHLKNLLNDDTDSASSEDSNATEDATMLEATQEQNTATSNSLAWMPLNATPPLPPPSPPREPEYFVKLWFPKTYTRPVGAQYTRAEVQKYGVQYKRTNPGSKTKYQDVTIVWPENRIFRLAPKNGQNTWSLDAWLRAPPLTEIKLDIYRAMLKWNFYGKAEEYGERECLEDLWAVLDCEDKPEDDGYQIYLNNNLKDRVVAKIKRDGTTWRSYKWVVQQPGQATHSYRWGPRGSQYAPDELKELAAEVSQGAAIDHAPHDEMLREALLSYPGPWQRAVMICKEVLQ